MTRINIKSVTVAVALLFITSCTKTDSTTTEPEAQPTNATTDLSTATGDQPQGNDQRVTPNLQEPGMGQMPAENQKTTATPAPDGQTIPPPPSARQ
jgi:hypothetical protein